MWQLLIIYDNYPYREDLAWGWGLSVLVMSPWDTVLFDTGEDGEALLSNLMALGVSPSSISKVVISHAHHDHTGGLRALLDANPEITVFVPRGAEVAAGKVVECPGPTQVSQGLITTGTLDNPVAPEQGLLVLGKERWLIVGCSHPGPVRMASTALDICQGLDGLLGGLHLFRARDEEIREVAKALAEMGIKRVVPIHCTGDRARAIFRDMWGEGFGQGGVGFSVKF